MSISLPEDFTNRMKAQLGADYDTFIGCYEDPAVKSLRLNTRKIKSVDYARLSSVFTGCDHPETVQHCDHAYYYGDAAPGKSAYHEAGAYYIQEASAMLPVTMLCADDSSQKILDLCAAPGGKSTQIADLMRGRGLLVSNEIIPSRASILSENIERMGVENALVISSDPMQLTDRFPMFFDRILVDAPCSGEGMFRRTPEAVSEWSLDNVKMCAERQEMLLDCAALMLSEGGRIVYSTCTFSPEEDEETVERFLDRHPEFEIAEGPVKLYPHTFRGEGHFAVAFERSAGVRRHEDKADKPQNGEPFPQKTWSASLLDDGLFESSNVTRGNERKRLLGKWLNHSRFARTGYDCTDCLLEFGDSLYLTPEYMPDITGLKVLRAGIKLGTFKKNRFEPDHALSHCLTGDDVKFCVDLDADSTEAKQYLSGMTINCGKDMKGWCLVCVGGFALGWGNANNGVLKNHYHKGLRKP